jgi:transcriptional regulator with XRE-family HTH domain
VSLGSILRQKREELGYTLDEVSNRIGYSKPYLSTIETGKVKNPPSDEVLTKLERTLEFEMGTLLYLGGDKGQQLTHIERSRNTRWDSPLLSCIFRPLSPMATPEFSVSYPKTRFVSECLTPSPS